MAVLSLVVLQYYSIHYNRLVAVLSLYVLQYYIKLGLFSTTYDTTKF